MDALSERGEAYGTELGAAVPGLRQQINIARRDAEPDDAGALHPRGAEGRIVRGRPKGSWISSQYRWSPAPKPPATTEELPTAEAQVELARAYLARVRPGDGGGRPVVDGLDGRRRPSARWRSCRRSRSTSTNGARARARRRRPGRRSAMHRAGRRGCSPPSTRPSWAGPAATSTSTRSIATTPARQALFDRSGNPGPDRLVGRADRRRLGAAQGRRDRLPAAGRHRQGRGCRNVESEAARTAEFSAVSASRPAFGRRWSARWSASGCRRRGSRRLASEPRPPCGRPLLPYDGRRPREEYPDGRAGRPNLPSSTCAPAPAAAAEPAHRTRRSPGRPRDPTRPGGSPA